MLSEPCLPGLVSSLVLKKRPFWLFHAASMISSLEERKMSGTHVTNIAVSFVLWYICGNVCDIRQDIETGPASK